MYDDGHTKTHRSATILFVTTEEQDLFVIGERAALGPLRRDLAATYARWVNHADVRFGLEHQGIATPETEQEWVDEAVKRGAEKEPRTAGFTVYDVADRAPVGTATLFNINHLHGACTFGIMLGERRDQGIGTDATRLVLDWAFHTLGLRHVRLEALAWNETALRAYENAGFQRVGVLRGAVMSRGQPADVVIMDAIPAP